MSSAKWRPFCLGLNVLTHLDPGRCGNDFKSVTCKHIGQPELIDPWEI